MPGNKGSLRLSNDTGYRNGDTGFAFVYSAAALRHDLALANGRDTWLGDRVNDADNSWNQSGWSTTALRSGDPATAEGGRRADGSLPATTFLANRRNRDMGASMSP
jgi:hypothetical protein